MHFPDLDHYGEFGFRDDYVNDPDDIMSIYNARKPVRLHTDTLPLAQQIKIKRIHDGLSQKQLGQIVGLSVSTISLIETGQRVIPTKRFKEFEQYLYDSWYMDGELVDCCSVDEEEDELCF